MAGYTREFLISAYLSRFIKCSSVSIEQLLRLEELAEKCYDEVGRDKFRLYASLDAKAIQLYKNQC
jgi:hypothetical protein